MRTLLLICMAALGAAWAADDEDVKGLPEAPGKDVVVKLCLSCHGAANFRKKRLTKDGWSEQVADMVDRGAQATDEQAATIVDYLTQTFGKESKVNVNTAPFEELKSVLGLTTEESRAVIAWRKENGDFKSWQDLQKVPGIDPQKVENKKEIIVF
jgi:competence protein ComEA